MANREAVVRCLAILQGQFPAIASTEIALASWEMALSGLTDEQVALGTELVLRYHTYGEPKAAHLLELARGKPVQVQNESVYAATYRTETLFAWEEHDDKPPGGLSGEEARAALCRPDQDRLPIPDVVRMLEEPEGRGGEVE